MKTVAELEECVQKLSIAGRNQELAGRHGDCLVPALPAAAWPVPPGILQHYREMFILLLFSPLLPTLLP